MSETAPTGNVDPVTGGDTDGAEGDASQAVQPPATKAAELAEKQAELTEELRDNPAAEAIAEATEGEVAGPPGQ